MGIECQTVLIEQHHVFCDNCGSDGPVGGSESQAKFGAICDGYRLNVHIDDEMTDLCEDCFFEWQQEQVLGFESATRPELRKRAQSLRSEYKHRLIEFVERLVSTPSPRAGLRRCIAITGPATERRGWFHVWTSDIDGNARAVVEYGDGSIEEVSSSLFRFTDCEAGE